MSKWISMVFISLIIIVLALAACAAPAPAPSPSPTPSPAPAPKPQGPIMLKFSYDMPPNSASGSAFSSWAKEIEEKCGGKVKIDVFGGGSLLKQQEAPEAVMAGVTDMVFVALQAHAKLYPVNQVINLPALNFPSTKEGMIAAWEAQTTVWNKYKAMQEAFSDVKVIQLAPLTPNFIISRKEIHAPDDLKGLVVGCEGYEADIVKAAGGAPENVIPPDLYPNLQKGVVDACTVGWMHVQSHKLAEVAKYYLDHTFGHKVNLVLMNMDSWNKLPADVQGVITSMGKPGAMANIDNLVKFSEIGRGLAKESGGIIYSPTPAETAKWVAMNQPITDGFLADMKKLGISDASAIFNDLKKMRDAAWK